MKFISRIHVIALVATISLSAISCVKSGVESVETDENTTNSNTIDEQMNNRFYYWYKDQKIPLTQAGDKKYILFESSNESVINDFLEKEKIKIISAPQDVKISTIIPTISTPQFKNLRWMIIEYNSTQLKDIPSALYQTPFFETASKSEVGLSHLFYVKLKSSDDKNALMQLAKENNIEVLGYNRFSPLWYTLQCTKFSKGNALGMANKFYETTLFAYAQPDLMAAASGASGN
ncbi:MAG TPA: hypothetical protein PKY86_08100 [Niabella sp.]|nr:hypothetical protein [Niabella sp.]HQX21630.1 hypothetical protein [Niabella sp.]HQX42189.1 hypothetical protein [Niabella sp.]HRB80153.1 hypothetical protein [Niabella sp.]HRC22285.1 hypothetical protein [Niabella sp.]